MVQDKFDCIAIYDEGLEYFAPKKCIWDTNVGTDSIPIPI